MATSTQPPTLAPISAHALPATIPATVSAAAQIAQPATVSATNRTIGTRAWPAGTEDERARQGHQPGREHRPLGMIAEQTAPPIGDAGPATKPIREHRADEVAGGRGNDDDDALAGSGCHPR